MNLYKYHSNPESLRNHDNAHNTVPELIIDLARNGHKLNSTQIKAIASNPKFAYKYAMHVTKGRWPEGEKAIATDSHLAYLYAINIIKGRWPEGETAIASNPMVAYLYVINIIKGRWPEGEKIIVTNPTYKREYETRFEITL